jgi:hypothetical protein
LVIYEKLTFQKYLLELILGRGCFFFKKSIFVITLEKVLSRFSKLHIRLDKIKEMVWGENEYIGNSVRNASKNSQVYLNEFSDVWSLFVDKDKAVGGIRIDLMFKKYILSELLYKKYFFYELCIQYAKESKKINKKNILVPDSKYIGPYMNILSESGLEIYLVKRFYLIDALLSVFAVLTVLKVFWKKKISRSENDFDNTIVCCVSDKKMKQAFKDVFSSDRNVKYVVSPEYITYFSEEDMSSNVYPLSLTSDEFEQLNEIKKLYLRIILKNFKVFIGLGFHLFLFFNRIIRGRVKAPIASGSYIFTCEHHDLTNSIRNEFIRSQGSKSILFPSKSLYVLQYYAEEFYENYDYVCSPGRQYEDTLLQNESLRSVNMQTGSFSIHKHGLNQNLTMKKDQTASMKSFVGDDLVVTVLCPGICKPTYHSEKKLMSLAVKLSSIDGVKIIIRPKPFVPENCYIDFYKDYVQDNPSILLTGVEYELFDFLPVTDLFITSYSTSACEVALCGANVLFVDFLNQVERFIFWHPEVIGGLLLGEYEAFDKILELINSADSDDVRQRYVADLERFVEYIGYKFENFESYRANLLSQLSTNVFQE